MKLKRVLACLFIVAALPLLASTFRYNPTDSVPFLSVAFAGHSVPGSYACTCGCPGCICDPGETEVECAQSQNRSSQQSGKDINQGSSPVGVGSASGFDFGSSALILALAFFVWTRFLRA